MRFDFQLSTIQDIINVFHICLKLIYSALHH